MNNQFIAGKLYLQHTIIDNYCWVIFEDILWPSDLDLFTSYNLGPLLCLDNLSIKDLTQESVIRFLYGTEIIKLIMVDNHYNIFEENIEIFLKGWGVI